MIDALFHRGVDVFRLNFSHGTPADHRKRMEAIRAVERKAGRPIGVLIDLQGPKIRIGTFAEGPVQLEEGTTLRLDLDPTPGTAKRVCLPHPEIFAILKPGLQLLLDDGKLRIEVERRGEGYATTRVKVGGRLSERKGVNIPDAIIPLSPLTAKDRRDLEYGLELGADWVALSFVQRPEDIDEARKLIGDRAAIMAKLEKPMAITKLDAIVAKADAIMVARGDLGVEMRPEQVPTVQRRILRACRRAGKPVIVATQMLESMIASPVPTRAEASDVATAVYDGADAVMLSAESASGQYPARGGRDHGPDHPRGRAGRVLPDAHRRAAFRAAGHRRRRDLAFAARGRAHRLGEGDGDLHAFRILEHPRLARATRGSDPEPHAETLDGATAGPGLGRAFGADAGDRRHRHDDRSRVQDGTRGRLCEGGRQTS